MSNDSKGLWWALDNTNSDMLYGLFPFFSLEQKRTDRPSGGRRLGLGKSAMAPEANRPWLNRGVPGMYRCRKISLLFRALPRPLLHSWRSHGDCTEAFALRKLWRWFNPWLFCFRTDLIFSLKFKHLSFHLKFLTFLLSLFTLNSQSHCQSRVKSWWSLHQQPYRSLVRRVDDKPCLHTVRWEKDHNNRNREVWVVVFWSESDSHHHHPSMREGLVASRVGL